MPKKPTLEIQEALHKFGEKLGFVSVCEEKLPSRAAYDYYAPTYDVVWYLELEKHGFNLNKIEKFFQNDPVLFNRIKKLPFAGFEIEGASTSSKNQVGNFANLHGGDFLFGFEVVNNKEANGEADTYRRGLKIKNYFSNTAENRNMFFSTIHTSKKVSWLLNVPRTTTRSTRPLKVRLIGNWLEGTQLQYICMKKS